VEDVFKGIVEVKKIAACKVSRNYDVPKDGFLKEDEWKNEQNNEWCKFIN